MGDAGMAERDARRELRACAGTQFDAQVVRAFLAILARADAQTAAAGTP